MKTLLTCSAHRLHPNAIKLQITRGWPLVLACLLALVSSPPSTALGQTTPVSPDQDAAEPAEASSAAEPEQASASEVIIEPTPEAEMSRKSVPWLGISTSEAPEALASQLDLEPGVGLVITYVAPESPASKGGLKKNDVIVQFEDQSLVHPAQLRKLVRVRKQGDEVKLAFFRSGKRQTMSVTLGTTKVEQGLWEGEERALRGNFKQLNKHLQDLHLDDTVRESMRILTESLGNIKIDQKEVQEDIRRGMEQGRKAIQDALRNVTNADPVRKVLENLAHSGVVVDDKADVIVRSSSKNVKSIVKSDETGTIVLLSNPKLHLTAHDKEGKLLFDGSIESGEDQSKVPRDLWERVEPLIKQMDPTAEEPEPKESK